MFKNVGLLYSGWIEKNWL